MIKKTLLFLLAFSIPITTYSQRYLKAKVILLNKDTLDAKIKVVTNMFDANLLNELSINKKITVVPDSGKKFTIKCDSIFKMTFVDFKNKQRLFVNNSNKLIEILYNGKIKWSRNYFPHGYDGSCVSEDFMANEYNEEVRITTFSNYRKKVKEITKRRTDLIRLIDDMKLNDESILEILRKYDED